MTPPVQKENFSTKKDPRTARTKDSKPPIRQSQSKVASVPLKSILKNASATTPSSYMPPAAKPPADDPLALPAYFLTAAETLLESMGPNADDISFHDLIEAYNTFSNRIRAQIRAIVNAETPQPALVSLAEYSRQIGEAFCRDLKRTREEPPHFRRTPFAGEAITQLDGEQVRIAQDLALLGQQVLRIVSVIFSCPPLYSIFTTNDLRSILSELLVLGSAPSIPNPTSRRTWTLVVWTLSVQNLPSAVLLPVKREIVSVVKRALEGQIGKDQAKSDGLKATTQLLKQHPSLFISPLLEVFPSILRHLTADSCIIRLNAVNALGRFALATTSILPTTNTSISTILSTFINSQTTHRGAVLRLRNLITTALSSDNPSHPADSRFWAVQLLASFVVLLDDLFFSTPRALKLTFQSLHHLAGSKQRLASTLHSQVWQSLIWVFSRIPIQDGADERRDAVFRTVKQDLQGGIGLALVLSLLDAAPNDGSCDTTDSVTKVLVVVEDMLSHGDPLMQVDGISVLAKLLYTPVPSTGSDVPQTLNMLAPQLFDGSMLHAKHESVSTAVRSMGHLHISQLRQLSDLEILRHWAALTDLWVRATNISLASGFAKLRLGSTRGTVAEHKENLLHGWQSLLLMPTDLTQGFEHLTTPDPFAGKIADLICAFIAPTTATADAQVEHLRLVNKMWRITTNVFQPGWLAAAAETVLGAVLKQRYDLADEQIRDMWAELCAQLIALGIPSAVRVVREQSEGEMPAEVQRQLWVLAVKSTDRADGPAPWMDLAYLLSISLRAWKMTESEAELWDRLLRATISSANADSIRPTAVVECVFELVGDGHRLSKSPEELSTLLSHVDLSERATLPEGLIRTVGTVLRELYPHQALAPTSLQFIRRVQDIILSVPPTLALPLLLVLQDSICPWLEDDANVLVGDIRAEIAQCLFSTPLSTIRDLEPSAKTLVVISQFLATVADDEAFERFWRGTYHGRDELCELYPESIKTWLREAGRIFGGSLAEDLSLEEDISRRGSSCAPESQASQASQLRFASLPSSSLDYYADASRYAFDTDTIGLGNTRVLKMEDVQGGSVSTARGHSRASTVRSHSRRRPSPSVQEVPQVWAVPSAALDQLQDYSSHLDETSMLEASLHESSKDVASVPFRSSVTVQRSIVISQPQVSSASTSSKRRRTGVQDPPVRKRRKTSPEPRFGHGRSNAVAGPSRLPGETISEPTSRRDSVNFSEHASSHPKPSRCMGMRKLILDYVAVPTFEESQRQQQLPTPSPSFKAPPAPRPKSPTFDDEVEGEDYASWDVGLSLGEVKDVQQAFGCETQDSSSEDDESPSTDMDVTMDASRNDGARSPSLGAPFRRSNTVPIAPRDHPPPLRRNKTSARLDALKRAYAAVADDASQPAEDLIQATRWVHKIGVALNEQMSRKLNKPR
ncbi:hypothetical protein B0H17DRAFT_1182547 [Mycena rosella]|uniref:Telomere-associated protein Rif1 N-terminal domain-containing protein n=1 Tax=Mycena rosella TaxID=1033263 RepID=A0AAD7D3S5_MYCRO|nr:hypothetical protein B0H17DRAFT_1182547 [Mycena rosella]